MQKLLAYLQEGFYIGANTSEVQVEFLAYNAEDKFYSLVRVFFTFENSGVLAVEHKVYILQNSAYDLASQSAARIAYEVIFVLLYLWQIALEIWEMKNLGHKWPQYFLDYSNVLDLASLGALDAEA